MHNSTLLSYTFTKLDDNLTNKLTTTEIYSLTSQTRHKIYCSPFGKHAERAKQPKTDNQLTYHSGQNCADEYRRCYSSMGLCRCAVNEGSALATEQLLVLLAYVRMKTNSLNQLKRITYNTSGLSLCVYTTSPCSCTPSPRLFATGCVKKTRPLRFIFVFIHQSW